MKTILGFYRIPSLANNNPGVIGTFGEISRHAMTYSTEDRNYKFPEYPDTELVTLEVVDETGQVTVTNTEVMRIITSVGQWLYGQHVAGKIPQDKQRVQFLAGLKTEFPNLNWKSIGTIQRSAENANYMPTYVEFVLTDDGYEYEVKVWLSDKTLRIDYEPFKLTIIPPIVDLNQFINNASKVASLLSNVNQKHVIQKYNAIRNDNPETRLDTFDLTWHDPSDPESMLNTTWTYVAYGANATDIDNIKTSIRDYLATNSEYDNWKIIFPSLYEENDFTITPLWNNIAVPDSKLDQNLYQSGATIANASDIAVKTAPVSYGNIQNLTKHVNSNLEMISTYYRGMMLLALGNPSNQSGKIRLTQLYPDYSSVPLSADFERMEEATRQFAESLNNGLEYARQYSLNDAVPNGYYRIIRNNKHYVGFLQGSFQFLILTKVSYQNLLG